ncbi:MAG TPA: sialate O-acetylesterase [Chitinophagaceae bacterium]|nr:sialate O-acetylesterase [Chitinophagaceae bacterium]
MRRISLLFFFLSATFSITANVSLPNIFSDHMVLQRNKPIHVWGWASPGENVKVSIGSASQSVKTNKQGKWRVSLPAMTAGGPHTLTISGKNTIQFNDVMIGEVWLCSGQSNMEWPLNSSANAEQEISQANYPMIRHIKVGREPTLTPQENFKGGPWQVCAPATAGSFTAVGYFFARELFKELNVPIGLINSTWGGTNVETWTSHASFFGHPEFAALQSIMPTSFDSIIEKQQVALNKMILNVQGTMPLPAEAKQFSWANYNDANWKTMTLPSSWENKGLTELDGTVWFRREFNIAADTRISNAEISLGPIDDIDSTFVNGIFIGATNRYNIERRYSIPDGVLKSGKNIIAVKVIDNGGGGGLNGTPAQMKLQLGNTAMSLTGDWKYRIAEYRGITSVGPNQYPSLLYNGMIHPLTNYPIAGVIWYQGESNAGRGMQYSVAFPLMIEDWRKQWKDPFPFYFVQLANYGADKGTNQNGGSNWAELRESQAATLRLPNTGMAVTIDIGESNDIHPRNKQDVGKRLAANALAKTYGKNVMYSGPTYQSMQILGNKAFITFSNVPTGFEVRNKYGYINGFEIAGADQKFYYAKAFIEGDKIAVFSEAVPQPVAVRYAWADDPHDVNLYNKEGFPAAPFRTDNWKGRTQGNKYEIQ